MDDLEMKNCKKKVLNGLKNLENIYGRKVDLVNINNQTIGTELYNEIKTILDEKNIPIEIDARVSVGAFMFLNRELAMSDIL